MIKQLRKIFAAVTILVAGICLFSPELAAANQNYFFASIVKNDAFLYIENFPQKGEKTNTSFEQILAMPEFVSLMDPFKKYIKGMDSIASMMTGMSPLSVLGNSSRKIGMAVIKTDAKRPGLLLWLDLGDELENFNKNLPQIETFLSTKLSQKIETIKTNYYELKIIPVGINKMAWLTMGNNLVFGEFSYVKAIADDRINAKDTILNSREYNKSIAVMQMHKGGTLAIANIKELISRPEENNGQLDPFDTIKKVAAEKLSLGFIRHKDGYKDVSIGWTPEGDQLIRKIFLPKNVSMKHINYAPLDTEYFFTAQMMLDNACTEGQTIVENLKDFNGKRFPMSKKISNWLQAAQKELQFDISEIFATLGSECSVVIAPSGSFAVIDIRSFPAFKAYIDQINIWLKDNNIKTTSYKGEEIQYYVSDYYPLPGAICFSVLDEKTLIIATSVQDIKKVINNIKNPEFVSLEKNEDFIKTSSETRKGAFFAYYKLKELSENVYDKTVPLLQMTSAIPFNPVDAGQIPCFAYFEDKLFGMAKSGWVIDGGFVQEYYSPIGMGAEIVSALDIYAAAPNSPVVSIFAMALATDRLARAKQQEDNDEK